MSDITDAIQDYFDEYINIDLNAGLQKMVDEYVKELKEAVLDLVKSCKEAVDNELEDAYFKEEQALRQEEADLIYWINK